MKGKDKIAFMTMRFYRGAFTVTELLVVIAILMLLASIMLPAMNRTRSKAYAIRCLSNKRQLTLGWIMYANDHNDQLVWNPSTPDDTGWIRGAMDYDPSNTFNTNTWSLTDTNYAKLWPYTRATEIYHCPADKSRVIIDGKPHPRVRSVSLSNAMNSNGDWLSDSTGNKYWMFRQLSDIAVMPSSHAYVFIDEHPDSIYFGDFAVSVENAHSLPNATMIDFPASHHDGAAGISFADGHADLHRWTDLRTRKPLLNQTRLNFISTPYNQDLLWLSERATVLRK